MAFAPLHVFDRFWRADQASVAVTFGVLSAVLLAGVGLVITTTSAYNQKTMHQDALDAAVLAGASLIDASEEDRIQEARLNYAANLKSSGLTIESSELLSATQSSAMFTVNDWTVTGRVRAEVKNFFSGFIGDKSVGVVVQAAAQAGAAEPVCVLALDPVSPQGFEVYGTAQFTARNCAAQANSLSGQGMRQYGAAIGRARQFGVRGGFAGTGFYPRPTTGVPTIHDPFESIPVPATGPCVDIASKLINTPAVLDPGTYCGGIRIMANSRIIMNPGVYVMLDGPFRIDSNSTVTGDEVTIAFTGTDSTLYLGSGAIVELTSPVEGPYTNIQFFQDARSSQDEWATMLGGTQLTFDGTMYFPTQDVWIGGGSKITAKSPGYIMVTEKMWFQDGAIIDVWQENSRDIEIDQQSASLRRNPALIR